MTEEVGKEKFLDGEAPAYLQHTSLVKVAGGILMPNGDPIRQDDYDRPRSDFGAREADTVQCVHCQMHWIIVPGSGMKRGFCNLCNGLTCGKQKCESECMPWEKQMEIREGSRSPTATQF